MKTAKRANDKSPSFQYSLLIIFSLLVILPFLFISCSRTSTVTSIDEKLAQVDVLISVREYDDAWSLLKKVAKDAQAPYDQLGIVRRALLLDRAEYAKTLLQDAIKTFPDNEELLAVYTHMLITEELYDEALEQAPKLQGGKYGSIYAELRFRADTLAIEEANKDDEDSEGEKARPIDYYSRNYLQAYVDIANTTGDGGYLRNAALIYALEGDMASAFSYHPQVMSTYDSPLFWAKISYDSLNFFQAIDDFSFFEHSSESLALLADAYLQVGNDEDAQRIWLDSIRLFPHDNPVAWYNVVQSLFAEGNKEQANNLLANLVETFPDYVPGLASYARFSLLDPIRSSDTIFTPLLEDRGITTLRMEREASIPRIAPSDALYHMEQSLARLQAKNNPEAIRLILEKTKLRWDSSIPPISNRQRIADVWALLEENVQDPFGYDPVLIQYALWFFCSQGMIAEADGLFRAHYASRYMGSIDGDDVAEAAVLKKPPFDEMEDWEYEFGGYIAFRQRRYVDAEEWLSFFVHEGEFRYATPISAAMNLISLYNGSGRRAMALELYDDALLLTADTLIQANIYYRIALIQHEMGETQSAALSLTQCLALNSGHNQARLMVKQIDVAQ